MADTGHDFSVLRRKQSVTKETKVPPARSAVNEAADFQQLAMGTIGQEIWEENEELRRIQAQERQDCRSRRLDVLCTNLNKTMSSIEEIEKITSHLYIIRKRDGSVCPSNMMVGNILYDIGNRVQQHGKFLMHTSRLFNLKCAQISIQLKKEEEDDIEVVDVILPNRVSAAEKASTRVSHDEQNLNSTEHSEPARETPFVRRGSNSAETGQEEDLNGTDAIEPENERPFEGASITSGETAQTEQSNAADPAGPVREYVVVKREPGMGDGPEREVDMSLQTDEATKQKLCALCNKKFTRAENLQEHLNRHSGTTFTCTKCDRFFFSPQRHADHFRVHKGELRCDECGTAFASSGKLSMHKLFHGAKKFPCRLDNCNKRFILKGDRDQHEGDHNPGGYYQCDSCKKKFKSKSGIKSHVSWHRRMEKM